MSESLSPETEGGFFFFHLMENHWSMDRLLANVGIVLITP